MNISKKILLLVLMFVFPSVCMGKNHATNNISDETVITQMNYCINTLTSIIHNKSISVLEHESDQLINNLTMEQIVGLHEIKDFRLDLMDAVSRFEITEEERNISKRVFALKRDNIRWSALSSALGSAMFLTGDETKSRKQMAFYVLLVAARTAVNYNSMTGDANMEELQALWELRKEDMHTINELRKRALAIVFELYNKYYLSEHDRLTEATSNLFNQFVSEENIDKRIRLLEDNEETYRMIPEYYYYLGMAYLDRGNYPSAKKCFLSYLEKYRRAPFLRYDERSGCIALSMLTYEKDLGQQRKEELIDMALKNLPGNSAAVLQCAMIHILELDQEEKGFQLIRAGIDDPKATDKEVLYLAAANFLPRISKYPAIYDAICGAFNESNTIGLDSYLTYLAYTKENAWSGIGKMLSFSDFFKRKWYTLWLSTQFSDQFCLMLPKNITFAPHDIRVYMEKHDDDGMTIKQLRPTRTNVLTENEINAVDCFKANKNLKYLFVEMVSPGIYTLRKDIDIDKVKDETWSRMIDFSLTSSDVEDIVEFCEDYKDLSRDTRLLFEAYEGPETTIDSVECYSAVFCGDTLAYQPHHSSRLMGHFVRFVLSNQMEILYKYDEDEDEMQAYMYAIDGVRHFANDDYQQAFLFRDSLTEEPSWWNSNMAIVKGWLSSGEKWLDSVVGECSWWKDAKSYVKGWIADVRKWLGW